MHFKVPVYIETLDLSKVDAFLDRDGVATPLRLRVDPHSVGAADSPLGAAPETAEELAAYARALGERAAAIAQQVATAATRAAEIADTIETIDRAAAIAERVDAIERGARGQSAHAGPRVRAAWPIPPIVGEVGKRQADVLRREAAIARSAASPIASRVALSAEEIERHERDVAAFRRQFEELERLAAEAGATPIKHISRDEK